MKDVIHKILGILNVAGGSNPKSYNAGQIQYRQKKWSAAEQLFRKASQENPEHAASHFKIGMCLFRQKQYYDAYKSIDKATELDPAQVGWQLQLEQSAINFSKLSKISAFQQSEILVKTIDKVHQPSAELYNRLALCLHAQGKWQEEERTLAIAVDKKPAQTTWGCRLADVHRINGRHKEAADQYLRVVDVSGDRSSSLICYLLAQELELAKGSKDAEVSDFYHRAIFKDTRLNSSFLGIGVFHQGDGKWYEAYEAYKAHLSDRPGYAEVYYRLGAISQRLDKQDDAHFYYMRAISLDVENAKYHFRFGNLLYQQERWLEASEAFVHAATIRNKHTPFWYYCAGVSLGKAGEYSQACAMFLAAYGAENTNEAISEYERRHLKNSILTLSSLVGGSSFPDERLFLRMCECHLKLREWENALSILIDIDERNRITDNDLILKLGTSLVQLGRFESANSFFTRANFLVGFQNRIRREVPVKLVSLEMIDGRYIFKCEIFNKSGSNPEILPIGMCLKHRERIGNEVDEICLKCSPVFVSNGAALVECSLNVSLEMLPMHYWDIFIDVLVSDDVFGDTECRIPIKSCAQHILDAVSSNPFQYLIENDDAVFYPYRTVGGKKIAFLKRPRIIYDSDFYAEREREAVKTYLKNKSFYDDQKAWLVFEKYSATAQDNAMYFFKYAADRREKVFYVLEQGSPDIKYLEGYEDKIIEFMSIEHMVMLLSCEMLISSEGRGHGYAWRRVHGVFKDALLEKKYVFLQHGVIGLKKLGDTFYRDNKGFSADRFICSTIREREIISNNFGYSSRELISSGLPRWDSLEDFSHEHNEILIMPTWRNWLEDVTDEQFLSSEYFHKYNEFLASQTLSELASKLGFRLNFILHPKIAHHASHFIQISKSIRVVDTGAVSIRELLSNSKLLITDYSSVAWDFVFLRKPVIFFQFDLASYERYQGAYMDMKSELPGVTSYDVKQLCEMLEDHVVNYSVYRKKTEEYELASFFGNERNSCEIIYNSLDRGM